MEASPGVAMDLPSKSWTEVIPELLLTTIPLPSICTPEITFTGTPFSIEDNTGVIPTYPTSTSPLAIAVIKSPPLLNWTNLVLIPSFWYMSWASAMNKAASWSLGR